MKMFQPMRAREKEDDQSEDIQGAEENSSVRHKIYVDFCDFKKMGINPIFHKDNIGHTNFFRSSAHLFRFFGNDTIF